MDNDQHRTVVEFALSGVSTICDILHSWEVWMFDWIRPLRLSGTRGTLVTKVNDAAERPKPCRFEVAMVPDLDAMQRVKEMSVHAAFPAVIAGGRTVQAAIINIPFAAGVTNFGRGFALQYYLEVLLGDFCPVSHIIVRALGKTTLIQHRRDASNALITLVAGSTCVRFTEYTGASGSGILVELAGLSSREDEELT